jgi:hypothetical protein
MSGNLEINDSRQAITAPYYSEIDLSALNENDNSSVQNKDDNCGMLYHSTIKFRVE